MSGEANADHWGRGRITYSTTQSVGGHHSLTNGTDITQPNYNCCTCFPMIDSQAKKKTFYIHKLIRAAAAADESDDDDEEGGDTAESLERAALCLENIRRGGFKYVIPKVSIPPKAKQKHVLLLGKTGCGKSLMGNVLIERYAADNGFRVSSSTKSVTKETLSLGNTERQVMVYDTKGFFDTVDWNMHNWPKTKEEIRKRLAKEIRDLWITVAHSGGIDSVALVVTQNRFDDKDTQLARMAAKNLFKGDLGSRLFIVITHSEICQNPEEQWVWLMENAETSRGQDAIPLCHEGYETEQDQKGAS